MIVHGRCHCRNIAFALTWDPDPVEIPARACTCSFCTKHGGVWTSHPAGSLTIRIGDATRVSRYCFETRTAEFLVCAVCGVVPLVTSEIEGRLYAVVNVNAFEGIDPSLVRRASRRFDNEDASDRLDRRRTTWIADVRYAGT